MATTYNNLYMDIRQELHCAGIDAATLEARELVAFAAGKTRQELLRSDLTCQVLRYRQRQEVKLRLLGTYQYCNAAVALDTGKVCTRSA